MDKKTIRILFFDEKQGWMEDNLEMDTEETDNENAGNDETPDKKDRRAMV